MTIEKKRDIVVAIILTMVTLGIYGIYWFVKLANDIKRLQPESTISGGKDLLLTLLTLGIYGVYIMYKYPKAIAKAQQENGKPVTDFAILSVILSVFGLCIIPWCMMQAELNKFAA